MTSTRAAGVGVRRAMWTAAGLTVAATSAILVQVLRVITTDGKEAAPGFTQAAFAAMSVLLVAFLLPVFIRRVDIGVGRGFAWLVGLISLVLSVVPWLLVTTSQATMAQLMYRGLRVPQGSERFWDLALVLRSVDCASYGFDVYAEHNGCLPDPSIYGPGSLWLQYVPFDLASAANAQVLGVIAMVISSLALVWIARNSAGRGALVILVAAVGAPWLLMLERGNFDVFAIWVAIGTVVLVRRSDRLWWWYLAAVAIWLLGTWKYYPFAMGLMLVPALRIRRGWTVIVAFAIASLAFVVLTWENLRFSLQSNDNMTEIGDYVVLGRIPIVARMVDAVFPAEGWQAGDLLVLLAALLAAAWGVAFALSLRRVPVHDAMLAAAGSALFLSSVLIAGFGWAYKAAFLLLAVPLLARPARPRSPVMLYSSLVMLSLVAVNSIVVWNTLLASIAGIVAGAFALGASVTAIGRHVVVRDDVPIRAGAAVGEVA